MKPALALIAGALGCVVSMNAFGFYCSTSGGNGYINVGDTMDAVTAACGAATSVGQPTADSNNAVTTVQYWMYSNAKVENSQFHSTTNPTNVVQMAPPQVIEVTNNKVTNITQNSQGVNQASCQQGGVIRIGESATQLMEDCGKPTSINTEQSKGDNSSAGTSTSNSGGDNSDNGGDNSSQNDLSQNATWSYDLGPDQPPLTLEFQDGQLKSINGSAQ